MEKNTFVKSTSTSSSSFFHPIKKNSTSFWLEFAPLYFRKIIQHDKKKINMQNIKGPRGLIQIGFKKNKTWSLPRIRPNNITITNQPKQP